MTNKILSGTNPYLLLILTGLFWGGNAVAGKLAAGHISPFLLTSFRWILAVMILLPLAWKYVAKDWPTIRKHLPFLCFCGFLGFTLFNNFLYLSLTYTSAINVAIEQASMPLVVFVLNYILFRTPTTANQLLGFAITMIGVTITAARGDVIGFFRGEFNIGDILMIIAITIYGAYSVLLRNKPDIHLLSFMTVLSVAALLASLPFTLYEATTDKFIFPDTQGWLVVIYAGLFPSILAQLFWVKGIEIIGSNRSGIFMNLVPVFGTVLAILILGEQFEIYHAIGFILVFSGVALAQKMSPAQRAAQR